MICDASTGLAGRKAFGAIFFSSRYIIGVIPIGAGTQASQVWLFIERFGCIAYLTGCLSVTNLTVCNTGRADAVLIKEEIRALVKAIILIKNSITYRRIKIFT